MRCFYCDYCAETDGLDERAPVFKEYKTGRFSCQECRTAIWKAVDDARQTDAELLDEFFDNVDGDELLEDSRMEDYSEGDY